MTNMPGVRSVTVSGNWRVFLKFSGTDVVEADHYDRRRPA
jgi:hypothetical protein